MQTASSSKLQLFLDLISAGFPSPAESITDRSIDLHQHLVQHPTATFLARATGNSMIDAGIFEGDLLVVDKQLTPRNNDIVVAIHHDEFLVKRLIYKNTEAFLVAENAEMKFSPITIDAETTIWGVVSSIIRQLR